MPGQDRSDGLPVTLGRFQVPSYGIAGSPDGIDVRGTG
jgi:hypothetical protein